MTHEAGRRVQPWSTLFLALCALPWIVAAAKAEDYQRGEFRFTVTPAASWVEPQTVAPLWDEKRLPSAGTRVRSWLYDSQYLRTGGQRERYLDYAYEAVSPAMLTEVGKVAIGFRPDFERLTIHEISLRRDGTWQSRLKPEAVTLARREAEFERDMALGSCANALLRRPCRSRRGDGFLSSPAKGCVS